MHSLTQEIINSSPIIHPKVSKSGSHVNHSSPSPSSTVNKRLPGNFIVCL